MSEPQNPSSPQNPPSSSSSTSTKVSNQTNHGRANSSFSALKGHFPNPPDSTNPDPATLRDQWRFAIRQYSKWYSHAWGTAILAGVSFFALGWVIKGSNPLPSLSHQDSSHPTPAPSDEYEVQYEEENKSLQKNPERSLEKNQRAISILFLLFYARN
ncbi:hypothetical protein CsatA_023109 [Cannabis sativa]